MRSVHTRNGEHIWNRAHARPETVVSLARGRFYHSVEQDKEYTDSWT